MNFRRAVRDDLAALVALLLDDTLGAAREAAADLSPYQRAFEAIDADANQLLLVGERAGSVIACLQLTFIAGLSRRGATRALVEAVRVKSEERNRGAGAAIVRHAIDLARRRGCRVVQLTSDKRRADAHRFYERLGFRPTHEGFKLDLE